MARLDLSVRYASPESAARAYADAAGLRRLPRPWESARRMTERGLLVPDGTSFRITALPPRRGSLRLSP